MKLADGVEQNSTLKNKALGCKTKVKRGIDSAGFFGKLSNPPARSGPADFQTDLFSGETTFWGVNRPTKNQALTGEMETVERFTVPSARNPEEPACSEPEAPKNVANPQQNEEVPLPENEIPVLQEEPKPPERPKTRKPAAGDGRLSAKQHSVAGRPSKSHGSPAESRGTRLPREEDFGGQLSDLARQVARLGPDHRNPHKFHEDKADVADQLRRLARALGGPR